MSGDDRETASQALRELARSIVREGVDGDHLEEYMYKLINKRLIELHGSCRYEVLVAARSLSGLGARDVATHLCNRACELEQIYFAFAPSLPPAGRTQTAISATEHRVIDQTRRPSYEVPTCRPLPGWFPETIAAIVYTGLGILLLRPESGNANLRLTAASAFCLLGMINAMVAIHSAWRYAHLSRKR